MRRCAVVLALAIWTVAGGVAHAAKSTLTVSFDTRSIASALWVPDNLPVIRGVMVFTGGQGPNDQSGDTRQLADNRFYQRFAESIGFAILGDQFTGSYTEAGSGPGQAVLDTLASYATKLNHPELAHAPLLLEGFSNGGYFSFTFAKWMPARVIAFALNKSGFAKVEMDPAFAAIPGVLFWGELEPSKGTPTVIHSLVVQGRAAHALWAELKEWGKAHEEGEAERVFVPFFADMVAARYPNGKTPVAAEVPLIALDEASGWIGDHSDASINTAVPATATFAAYGGDKAAASWLPNEGIANLWRGFVTQAPILLDTPVSEAQLSATQLLQLSASGMTTEDTVTFLDGANEIAKNVAVNANGEAKGQWMPGWGGGRGILALGKTAGVVTHTSRPSVIALYGKAPPPGPPQPEPSADPAGAGPGNSVKPGQTVGTSTPSPSDGAAGSGASDAGVMDAVDASDGEADASLAADGGEAEFDAVEGNAARSGGRAARRGGDLAGGACSVAAGGLGASRRGGALAFFVVAQASLVVVVRARRRKRKSC